MTFKNKILTSAIVLASAYGSMAMGAAVNSTAVTSVGGGTGAVHIDGDTLTVQVTFDAAIDIDAGGIPTLGVTYETGGPLDLVAVGGALTAVTTLSFSAVLTGVADTDGIDLTTISLNGAAITDNVGGAGSTIDLTGFTALGAPSILDAIVPTLAEVTPVTPNPTADSTPDYIFSTTESVDLTIGGTCGSSSSLTGVTGSPTIVLTQADNSTALATGTYGACTIIGTDAAGNASSALAITSFAVDVTAPTLSAPVVVATPGTDATPVFGFTSDEIGTTSIANCTPAIALIAPTAATVGANTITLSGAGGVDLAVGTYTGCQITVTDALTNASSAFAIADFEITAIPVPPVGSTPVPLNYPWVMLLTLAGLGFVVRKRFPKVK